MPLSAVFAVPHPPLLIPEIGRGEEKKVQSTFNNMDDVGRRIAQIAPETIIVVSPHAAHLQDRFVISGHERLYGDMRRFYAKSIFIDKAVNTSLATRLYMESSRKGIATYLTDDDDFFVDHATIVPLYFIDKYYSNYKLIIVSLSELSPVVHTRFGQSIARAAENDDDKIVLIASGDLSHRLKKDGPYGYSKSGALFDQQIIQLLRQNQLDKIETMNPDLCLDAGECGWRSLIIMAGALSSYRYSHNLLSYESPFGVGYPVCAFEDLYHKDSVSSTYQTLTPNIKNDNKNSDKSEVVNQSQSDDPYVTLAKQSLFTYLQTGQHMLRPKSLPEDMCLKKAGVFVSIKKYGSLRGCIGTIQATTDCIADEIIRNAVEAGTADPRFSPVTLEELDKLSLSVDILGLPEHIDNRSLLDPKKYGVIVRYKGRSGLLLPRLEGVDSVEEQINIALAKAGISPNENYTLERFEVVRHS